MAIDKVIWKLSQWYLSQPMPPFPIETLGSMINAMQSNKKIMRVPWDIKAEDIQSNIGSFLKHLQISMGKTIDGLQWAFYPVIEGVCPGCKKPQKFVYSYDFDDTNVQCPGDKDCYEWVSVKKLGFKKIPEKLFPVELKSVQPNSSNH